jgi:hypothetical protein
MRKLICLVSMCFCLFAFGQAPLPDALLKAKTAFVVNDGVQNEQFDKFYNEIKKWGRFEIVQDRQKASIIVLLSARPGKKAVAVPVGNVTYSYSEAEHYIQILDARDETVLWSDFTGYWSNNPKGLVSNLRKKMERR